MHTFAACLSDGDAVTGGPTAPSACVLGTVWGPVSEVLETQR